MKKLTLLVMAVMLINTPFVAEAKSLPKTGEKTSYYKTVEYYDASIDEMMLQSTEVLPNDYESVTYELTKEEYYSELYNQNNIIQPMALTTKTSTTSYKTLTVSYEPTSGGKYRVIAKVDWDQMPYYRKIDHLGTTHSVSNVSDLQCGSMTYVKGGTTYNSSHCNALLFNNEYYWTYGQFVDHDLPNDGLFDKVTDIKFQISYEVNGNPGSDLAAVIYHQDISSSPVNNLNRYFVGRADIRLSGPYYDMGYYFSIQTVKF